MVAEIVSDSCTSSQSTTLTTYYASKANDNNISTFNSTSNGAGEWWRIDLGEAMEIHSIRLLKRWGYGDRPQNYYIQTADDYEFTTNVQTIVTANSETSESGGNRTSGGILYDTSDFGSITVRYIRLLCHTTSQYINMDQFDVYVDTQTIYTVECPSPMGITLALSSEIAKFKVSLASPIDFPFGLSAGITLIGRDLWKFNSFITKLDLKDSSIEKITEKRSLITKIFKANSFVR